MNSTGRIFSARYGAGVSGACPKQQYSGNEYAVCRRQGYDGKHRETLRVNGWMFCPVDIMDEDGTAMLPVRGGMHLKEISVGKNMLNYDSMVVLTHFKGHPRGGFGGSMKIWLSAALTDKSASVWCTE